MLASNKYTSRIFSIITLFLLTYVCDAYSDDLQIDIGISRSTVYIGESLRMTIKFSGTKNRIEPDLSAIQNCQIKKAGTRSSSQKSFNIVGGKRTSSVFYVTEYNYEIIPSKTGTFHAGPISALFDGRRVTKNGPQFRVVGATDQDLAYINITASKESVIVDEPFEITLTVALKRLPERYSNMDPLDPKNPPYINAAYINTQHGPSLDAPDLSNVLSKYLTDQSNSSPSFFINNLSFDRGLFNAFSDAQLIKFMIDKRPITKNGKPYFEYSLKMNYTGKEESSHTFGPATFKGNIIKNINQADSAEAQPVYAISSAVTVKVEPPPTEGRPVSFMGAIGSNVTAKASLDSQTCKVGDPLKLTLSVSGDISIRNAYPPHLSKQINLTKDFRIYEDNIQTKNNGKAKEFIYTIRPTTAGTLEFPPIDVSYYDADSMSYKTAQTQPIPVKANESSVVADDFVISTTPEANNTSVTILSADSLIIAPLDMNTNGAIPVNMGLDLWHIIILILSPLTVLTRKLISFIVSHSKSNESDKRKQDASQRAIAVIHSNHTAQTLYSGIMRYIAHRFDAIEASLTPADAAAILKKNQISEAQITDLSEILEKAFHADFSTALPQDYNSEEDRNKAISIITAIEKEVQAL